MIPMLDTSASLDDAEAEFGMPVEELLTPLTRRTLKRPFGMFAIDNGAFANFRADYFVSLLERNKQHIKQCRFVAVPDVVGSAIRTLEVFDFWKYKISKWPLAYVAQDGQGASRIPWDDVAALFIGGTNDFKMGQDAVACIKAAKALGKWVHVGRVNMPDRFAYFEDMGCDSCDGTGIARRPEKRHAIREAKKQGSLFDQPMAEKLNSEEI